MQYQARINKLMKKKDFALLRANRYPDMTLPSSSCSLSYGRTTCSVDGSGVVYSLVKSRKGRHIVSSRGETISLFNDAVGDEAKYYNISNLDGLIRAGQFLIAYNRTMTSFIAHDLSVDLTACSFRYNGPVWRRGRKIKNKKMKKRKERMLIWLREVKWVLCARPWTMTS